MKKSHVFGRLGGIAAVALFVGIPAAGFAQALPKDDGFCSPGISGPSLMETGTTQPIQVPLRNSGNTTWVAGSYFVKVLNPQTWTTEKVYLPKNVAPRGMVYVSVNIKAPLIPGTYDVHVRMANAMGTEFGFACSSKGIKVVPPPPKADVSIAKVAPNIVQKGSVLVYELTGKNAGPDTAEKVGVYEYLPRNAVFLPALSSPGCVRLDRNVIRCDLVTLKKDESKKALVAVDTSTLACETVVKNQSYIAALGTKDPNGTNNIIKAEKALATTVTCKPLPPNELTLTVKNIGSTDTAVTAQKGITLFAFEAAADNENILINQFMFDAAEGSLMDAKNYSLLIDADGDSVVETVLASGVTPQSGLVTFDSIAPDLAMGAPVRMEVRADVVSYLRGDRLRLQFATATPGFIQAERTIDGSPLAGIKTDGVCATTCEITVQTVPAKLWIFVRQGNVYISRGAVLKPHQLLGGTVGDPVLSLQMRAEHESVNVVMLRISVAGPVRSSLDSIELYRVPEVIPFAKAYGSSCGSDAVPAGTYCASMPLFQQLVVPKDASITVLLRPRMKTDLFGAISGDELTFGLEPVLGKVPGVDAIGAVSYSTLLHNDGDTVAEGEVFIGSNVIAPNASITGLKNTVVLSKLGSLMNVNPDVDGTGIPMGSVALGQFRFSALAHDNDHYGSNDWVLEDIIFSVTAKNVALDPDSYRFFNKSSPPNKISCSEIGSAGDVKYVACQGLSDAPLNTAVTDGKNSTFVLEVNVLMLEASPGESSMLQVAIEQFSDAALASFGQTASHLRWIDKDNSAPTSYLWAEDANSIIRSTRYQN